MPSTEPRATRFEVAAPAGRVRFWIWMLCVVLPLSVTALALGIMLAGAGAGEAAAPLGASRAALVLTIIGVPGVVLPLAVLLQRSLHRLSVEFDGASLDVRAGWYRLRVSIHDIDVSQARIVSLDEHTEYRPGLKTNAVALPGYHAGHFRLRDWRRRAFLLLTTRERVLALPLRDRRTVLLSLRQPQRLIEALRAAAG